MFAAAAVHGMTSSQLVIHGHFMSKGNMLLLALSMMYT